MNKSHILLNKTTREWVIYAPNRDKRPHDFKQEYIVENHGEIHSPKCPFSTGNEDLIRPIILEKKQKILTGKFVLFLINFLL